MIHRFNYLFLSQRMTRSPSITQLILQQSGPTQVNVCVPLTRPSLAGCHGLDFLFGFSNVECMVRILYHDVPMWMASGGFPIWIAYCGVQGLDFLSGYPFLVF